MAWVDRDLKDHSVLTPLPWVPPLFSIFIALSFYSTRSHPALHIPFQDKTGRFNISSPNEPRIFGHK